MSKISTYEVAPVPKLSDKLIGTSVGGEIEDVTYNFTLQELLDVFLPVIPANNLQGILDYGNTATQDINLFGTITTTNLEVTDTANLFITYLNEETHIVGSLFDSADSVGTAGQVLTSTGEGVEWYTLPPIFTPNLEQVLTEGNTSDIGIILDANIEAIGVIADTANIATELSIQGTVVDYNESSGTAGQVLESTSTGVQWVNLPVYSATSPLLFNPATGVFSIQVANSTQNGYLSSADWITFNGKQNAGSYITALTGEATATGPGSVPITLNNASVINKVLTGLNVTGGNVLATDSILTAFGKVQNQINGLVGGVQYQGTWDAATNTPTLTSSVGTQGYYYIVSVDGNTNLNGITDWKVGDWAIFSGGVWQKVDNTDSVTSVNGFTGAVSLTTDNIPEGTTNLYFLNSRARAAVSATSPLLYNNTTGVFSIQQASGIQNGFLSSTDWTTFNSKQDYLGGTGLVKSTAGTITYITDNSSNWNTAYNRSLTSAAVTGTSTKTLTLNQQDGGTITASWSDADTGLTSVGLSMPSAFTVSNSPLTSNGTIGVTGAGTTAEYIRGDGSLATFPSIISEAQNLVTEVYNSSGATLTKGTVVYINGGQGNLPTITKAIATGDPTSAQTYGVVRSDITNMNNGYVVVTGRLADLDTRDYTPGQQLYLSSTTAGAWTPTKQYAPAHLVYVGIVVRAHPTQGVVEILIQNGFEMDELHNVAAQNPDNNDILQFKTSTNLWTKVAGTTTNIAEGTNLYYTDLRARGALSLTTTGTSGAATYDNTTGVFNIPQYQEVITNPITGTGTTNTLSKFTSASSIGNSNITDTGSLITLGSNTYVNGSMGFGTSTVGSYIIRIVSPLTGGTTTYGISNAPTIQSDVTGASILFRTAPSTVASTFTLGSLQHFTAGTTTIGAGSTVTNQFGFLVLSTAIGATNNYAFSGQLSAATNTWNLHMSGTANNYMAGALGIARTSLPNMNLGIDRNITGSTVSYGIFNGGAIQSDVTATGVYYTTSAATAAATFTLNALNHYSAVQSTFGAGSSVTTQTGFLVNASLIGATNNWGFRGAIPSGTNRFNLYMDGTANNYLAGDTGIGGVAAYISSGPILTSTLTNGGSGYVDGTYTDVATTLISSTGVGALFTIVVSGGIVTSATLTWGGVFYKTNDTISVSNTLLGGTGSGLIITVNTVDSSQLTIANANGGDISLFRIDTGLVTGDNLGTIKFLSNDASTKASGIQAEIGAYAAGSAGGAYLSFLTSTGAGGALTEQVRIGNGGQVGIGGAYSLTGYSLRVSKNITGAVNSYGIASDGEIQSGVTTSANLFYTSATTAATTFTLTSLNHFAAVQGTFGAGSTVTNQYGFIAGSSLIGATNNYGFFGNIASGTNRWNLYMNGTANNYLNGNTGIGSTIPSGKLEVNVGSSAAYFTRTAGDNGAINPALAILTSSTASRIYSYGTALEFFTAAVGGTATEKMRLSDIGSFGIGTGSSINASAKVQIDSTSQGFLPPRMTLAQRTAIASPATGLIVYQTDGVEGLWVNTSTGWRELTVV